MARWYAPVVALLALLALLGIMQWTAAPARSQGSAPLDATATEPSTATPTVTPTATPTLTATPAFVVDVYVTPSLTVAVPGSTVLVTISVAVGPDCSYPIYEQTLSQSPTLFAYVDPPTPTLRVGDPFSGSYLLRAVQTGTMVFIGTTYGERYCGDFYQWEYEQGTSALVTVTTATPRQYFPRICSGSCRR